MVKDSTAARAVALDRRDHDKQSLLAKWFFATSIGFAAGGLAAGASEAAIRHSLYQVVMSSSQELAKSTINVGLALSLWGTLIATMQWTLLRRRLDRAGWWIPVTIAGWGLAGAMAGGLSAGFHILSPTGAESDVTVTTVAVGSVPLLLLPGLIQWVWLRRQVAGAAVWLLASAGAQFLAIVAASAVVRVGLVSAGWLRPEDFPSVRVVFLAGVVMGPVVGTVTGVAIGRLLRQQVGI
jgi:hypothetical protein